MAQRLVGSEEEGFFFEDRSAKASSELVALEGGRLTCKVEEVTSVEHIVAQVLKQLAVELASAAARRNVDDSSRALTVLCAKG